ncbi:MAG: tetratricopeptide repeat protein [Isosphaerales bacterium]
MGWTTKIAMEGGGFRPAVLSLAVGLMLAGVGDSRAQRQAGDEWAGKAVVPKTRNFTIRVGERGIESRGRPAIYHVDRVNGPSLLISTPGQSGWVSSASVVPLDQAGTFFSSQIRANPRESFNHAMRAIVLLSGKPDVDRALADVNEAVRLDPHSVTALILRASIWADRKEYDRAIADYSEVIRHDPMVFPAYFGRAAVQGEKGDYDKAIADLDKVIGLDPRLPDSYLVRAVGWKHKKEYDKAIADLNEAIRLDPRSAAAYHDRGLLYSDKKQYDKAIADFSEAIRLEPAKASGYCNRGFAWKAEKEYDNAVADFTEAIRLDPRDSDAYCGRGWARQEKKDHAKALADFDQALRLDSRDACALDGRGWIWATSPDATVRDGKKAVEAAIEACELTRWRETYCLETLAAGYAEVGDFAAAVKWQTKAIELETDPSLLEEYRPRLKLYQDKKPFRDTKP